MAPSPDCAGCGKAAVCQAAGNNEPELSSLRHVVERTPPIRDRSHLNRSRSPFSALHVVQSGMAMTIDTDREGNQRVLEFHLPGELIGLEGIGSKMHRHAVVALGQAQFCRLPFASVREMAVERPEVMWYLIRVASQQLAHWRLRNTTYRAEVRFAAFLVDMHRRRASLGMPMDYLPLPMSREDIGNYLGMTTETVSRQFSTLRASGMVVVDRKGLRILNVPSLREMGKMSDQDDA